MSARRERIRLLLFVGVCAASLAITLAAYGTDALKRLELHTVDTRFSLRGDLPRPAGVVVVAIDDATFSKLKMTWPFPRRYHARVIDRLCAAGARVVAYDIQFTEPTDNRDDQTLADAAARCGKVVFGTTEVGPGGSTNVLGGAAVLRTLHARAADSQLPLDADGVIRRFPRELSRLPSFAIAATETATGRRISRSQFPRRNAWIDFTGPPGRIVHVSFVRVLKGQFARDLFRGRIAVVGATEPVLQDVHPTPTSANMPGAEIEASAIDTTLRDFPLRSASPALGLLLIVALAIIAPLANLRLRPLPSFALAVGVGGGYAWATQLAFDHGHVLPFVYPTLALVLSAVGSLAIQYVVVAFERERDRDVFARFVPEAVVGKVLARTNADLRLGGERVVATVLFSDLRGFTTFSETKPPDRVIDVLNQYLGEMTQAILDHGGTLVSYTGDGIMAVFGAPLDQPDHADRALTAAREMLVERLPRFNRWLEAAEPGETFAMGIGLNTGPIMAGMVGHARRMEYTAIGDVTNTASRIEGLTKATTDTLLLADSTRNALRHPPHDLELVGEFDIRGRVEQIRLWTIPSLRTTRAPIPTPTVVEPVEAPPLPTPAPGG